MSTVSKNDILALFEAAGIDKVNSLDPTTPLTEQGLDSLDMMNVYFQLDEKYGVSIDDDDIGSGSWDSLDSILAEVNKRVIKSL